MKLFLRVSSTVVVVALGAATLAALPPSISQAEPLRAVAPPPVAMALSLPPVESAYRTEVHEVAPGETASEILREMKAPADAILKAAKGSLNKIKTGDELRLDWRTGESQPWRVRFCPDGPSCFEAVRGGDGWVGRQRPIPYTIEQDVVVELSVTSTLWEAGRAAGLSGRQIMNLSKIFETDVDFNTELSDHARFKLVAERLTDAEGHVRYGELRGALLENSGKTYVSIRFKGADGTWGWFSPDAKGRKKTFLRSPIEYSRISSGFNLRRLHPILNIRRPHLGVDFGAPAGTPIRAAADGVVVKARYSGGHGNYIEIKHEGPYATSYSHLSAYLVKQGQVVHQGDVIGKVGSTGLSTAPHLHYQFMINGKHVDPLTVDLPMTGGMSDVELTSFRQARDEILTLLGQPIPKE